MVITILILVICAFNLALTFYGVSLIEGKPHYYDEQTVTENVSSSDQTVTEMMTVQEHVLLREEAHDERIRQMKDELARKYFPTQRPMDTDSALELDPDVKNLPHNIIDGRNGRSLTEVSE